MKRWFWLLILGGVTLLAACNPLDRRTKAGLQVITADASASLFLDGQYLDKSPFISKAIKPGRYTLKIQPDDPTLVPYETSLELRQGLLTVVTWKAGTRPEQSGGVFYEMEKLSGTKKAELAIVSIPDGAIVSVETQEKEFTPLNLLDLEPGQREFEVSLPSYDTQKHTVNLVAGHKTTITVKLAKSETTVINTVPPTPTPTPEATPQPSPVVGSGSRQASISAQQTASGSSQPSVLSGPRVKINPTNFFQDGREVLRVRASASNAGQEVGFAPVGTEYAYLGKTENGWHHINFNGTTGWVSGQLTTLLRE
jgi:hypothetical protein